MPPRIIIKILKMKEKEKNLESNQRTLDTLPIEKQHLKWLQIAQEKPESGMKYNT